MAAITSKTSSTTTGARPSDGSSMSSSRGRAISARPMASICCSPAGEAAGPLARPLGQAGEQLVHRLRVRVAPARARR